MGFREVSIVEIKEVLRLWVRGYGQREIARLTQLDRKTVARYLEVAGEAGLSAEAGEAAITEELVGALAEALRPGRRSGGHGEAWGALERERPFLEARLQAGLRLTKIHELLRRRGVEVPYRTLHRFFASELGYRRKKTTVRVADPDPGQELQVDFGRMGLLPDPAAGRRRLCWALVFTAVFSRHTFVHLTHRQTLEAVVEGFEAAWAFFGGVFPVVIPDNLKAIVDTADPTHPRLNPAFLEYAQSRGFVVDPARVGRAQDKPRVERAVPYVRESFFRGEEFRDRADAQARATAWCLEVAGKRLHRTTQRRPVEAFLLEERERLLPAPETFYDLPLYAEPKVHPDHHIEVGKALYSVPGGLIGEHVGVRADRHLVRISHRGRLVKVHPRQAPGGRATDRGDLPQEKTAYALRDLDRLKALASSHGDSVGTYAERLLDDPLPWTRMRQVYRLLGLCRRYGAERVEEACGRALELDVVDVRRVARMLERALEGGEEPPPTFPTNVVPLRFARDPAEFSTPKGGDDA